MLSTLLTGCETRTPPSSSEESAPTVEEALSDPEVPLGSGDSEGSAGESSTCGDSTGGDSASSLPPQDITDPAKVADATVIVSNALKRAAVCDLLYRGQLATDPDTVFSDPETGTLYYLVEEEQFPTVEDVQFYWAATFASETTADARYETIRQDELYRSVNDALYLRTDLSRDPLTMGKWKIGTLRLLTFGSGVIQVGMETTLVGQENGEQMLELRLQGEHWLLTDSYFLGGM